METIIGWQSHEHHFDKKPIDWYWKLGIVALGSAILAFYFDNMLFGIFIIIASFTIGYLSYKDTRIVPIQITTKGILFGNKLYPFKDFRSFWIDDDHTHGSRILLHPLSAYAPFTTIHINEEQVALGEIQEILSQFLEEEFLEETIIHKWLDKLLAK